MKKIGFLSFGHYQAVPGSTARTAGDALLQMVDLAVASEEIGVDGAYMRVHHFARQFASPFPLLSAMAARTTTIELGTGVIDMRYENPLYMAEAAAASDLLAQGRLQLGISRGSPETALNGAAAFGYVAAEGETDADMARQHTAIFRAAIAGQPLVEGNPQMTRAQALPIEPHSEGLGERIWWGSGTRATAKWTAEQGMNLMSSTLLTEDTGVPFDELQAEQIQIFRDNWAGDHEPRVSVSRSIIPLVSDRDRAYFGGERSSEDQVGYLDGGLARFGKSYVGEPDVIAAQLAQDAAVQAADTVLVTVPNQLGVDYNAALLENIVKLVAPGAGWR